MEISILGHNVDLEGMKKQPEKLKCMNNFSVPKKVKDVCKFLGVYNCYSQFLDSNSDTIAPLMNFLKQRVKWKWSARV